ncbi:hypothetical protein CCP2SC5_1230010 [Azospirillaceae bacterium]
MNPERPERRFEVAKRRNEIIPDVVAISRYSVRLDKPTPGLRAQIDDDLQDKACAWQ